MITLSFSPASCVSARNRGGKLCAGCGLDLKRGGWGDSRCGAPVADGVGGVQRSHKLDNEKKGRTERTVRKFDEHRSEGTGTGTRTETER